MTFPEAMSADELKGRIKLWMLEDSTVRCSKCGKEKAVNFAQCMRYGWPVCHKLTMTLTKTTAKVEDSVTAAIKDQLPKPTSSESTQR